VRFDPLVKFESRAAALPRLGLGISTEFGAAKTGLDPLALRRAHPELVEFLEIGVDLERGVDETARAWCAAGWPTTYHFLDGNLEEAESLDPEWQSAVGALARELGAAWLCGDAGLWHLGPRDRGHGLLAPPVLCADSARAMAENVRRLRESLGLEVLPENPPAHVLVEQVGNECWGNRDKRRLAHSDQRVPHEKLGVSVRDRGQEAGSGAVAAGRSRVAIRERPDERRRDHVEP